MLFTFSVFHIEKSGIYCKDIHSLNNPDKLLALLISHLEMSGNDINEEHLENMPDML